MLCGICGCEFQRVFSEVDLHVVISVLWYSQYQFVVPHGGEKYWQFSFVVSNLDEDLHHVGDVSGSYGSPVDHFEGF